MKKIAIVGVEGSGKTVMMAAMGEQWERPDERGYFLEPKSAETFGFSKSVMSLLRSGKWPNSNNHDEMRQLEWCLRRRQGGSLEKIADVSIFDYAGEAYRQAFGGEKKTGFEEAATALKAHVDAADVLIVLVNLSDIISGSMSNRRTRDAMWLTKSVLDYALGDKPRKPHVAIVFTQADSYREIISANGGTASTLKNFLPQVANLYDDLPIFTVSAIDKTVIGSDGLPVPHHDFKSSGLNSLMEWIIECSFKEKLARKVENEKRHEEIEKCQEELKLEFFYLCGGGKYCEAVKAARRMRKRCFDDSNFRFHFMIALYRSNLLLNRNEFRQLYNSADCRVRAKIVESLFPPASVGKALRNAIIAFATALSLGLLMNLSPKLKIDWIGSLFISSVIGGMIAIGIARNPFSSRKDDLQRFHAEMSLS